MASRFSGVSIAISGMCITRWSSRPITTSVGVVVVVCCCALLVRAVLVRDPPTVVVDSTPVPNIFRPSLAASEAETV